MHQTQAQIIATEHAANMGRDLIDTIKRIAKRTGFVSGIGLTVSMPHQMAFILSLVTLQWADPQKVLLSLTVVAAAIGIPVMIDLLILNCIGAVATRGVERKGKNLALRVIWYPILVSGAVNVAAPAPWQLRVLLAVMVTFIPTAETLRAAIRADFREIHEIETQAGTVVVPDTEDDPDDTGDRAARIAETRMRVAALTPYQRRKYDAMTPYGRRKYLVQIAEKRDAVVPTSPAPAGMPLVKA